MSGADAFFDTNVVLYLLSADAAKADRAEELLAAGGTISVQVLNGLSVYGSLIAAAALLAGCKTLYSEDMQDGQVIERKLTIRNPFKVG
jgi:predicted nucleic acid-binding protein